VHIKTAVLDFARKVWRCQRGKEKPFKSKKNRQSNGWKKKNKWTNNDLHWSI